MEIVVGVDERQHFGGIQMNANLKKVLLLLGEEYNDSMILNSSEMEWTAFLLAPAI